MGRKLPIPTIYIIDDEDSVRRALERLFQSAGIVSKSFASVEEFLRFDYSTNYTCVISDISFPGISGLKLPVELKRIGKQIPVIFVTAYDTQETRHEANRAGAVGFFRKPVDDQALIDVIDWALERKSPLTKQPLED
jgi:FixJ family two-component response regulator